MADRPVVGQLPPFVKCNNASAAFVRGDKLHNGTATAKSPIMCMMRTIASTAGNLLAKNVLKIMQKITTAQTIKVPCHRSGIYVG